MFSKFNSVRRLFTLFALILFHHVRLGWFSLSSPMMSLPLLGTDCLSFPLSGGPGPPSPPSPTPMTFSSDPRQQPVSSSGTITVTENNHGQSKIYFPDLFLCDRPLGQLHFVLLLWDVAALRLSSRIVN
jgi:hypothetical protein